MKVTHWTAKLGSGLEGMAKSMSGAERALGIDSVLCDSFDEKEWGVAEGSDVHVLHVHFPPKAQKLRGKAPIVWMGHGTPEYTFSRSVEAGAPGNYGFGDSFMLMQYWLQHADAIVTFWPRHEAIYRTMVNKHQPVICVPQGVDQSFWRPGLSEGKWAGSPSVWTAENAHQGKWALDLLLLWPWIAEELLEATLHVSGVPQNEHRFWFPLVNSNGTHFRSYLSSVRWGPEKLRNALRSIDFFVGLVRYGDHNLLSAQANACGAKTISYRGNPYSDFWITEGDQREMAKELLAVLKGETKARTKERTPDIRETAAAMLAVYEGLTGKKVEVKPDERVGLPPVTLRIAR